MAHGGALGPRRVSPAEAALVTAVLGTGAAQTDLLPALMAAYAHADHVVGLDVDKDQVRFICVLFGVGWRLWMGSICCGWVRSCVLWRMDQIVMA